jgi:site-specific DNA-methyltransferase (adenine-specific)
MTKFKIIHGDCLIEMNKLIDEGCQVDSIVTDPPYEISFMGKSWDSTGIAFNVETWKKAYALLKQGGYLLAFSGSRTYHRMALTIENAGFTIQNQNLWIYGSGFPKSLNVANAIDALKLAVKSDSTNISDSETNVHDCLIEGKQWEGWGTALKPGYEPIVVASKGTPNIGLPIETSSNFYYSAKANKNERHNSKHPTIKPLSVMKHLTKLVTPKDGLILDPFSGSGTTGESALLQGYSVILIEREAQYIEDIKNRLDLFGLLEF